MFIFNSILFPGANSSQTQQNPNLIFIKKRIPCFQLTQKSDSKSSCLMLAFHGNAEDIMDMYSYICPMWLKQNCDLMIMEQPSQAISNEKISGDKIYEYADTTLEFCQLELGQPINNILIMGRSIGTAPAIQIASKQNIAGLILISPFSNIGKIVKDKVGFSMFDDLFKNDLHAAKIICPTIIFHGVKDFLIKKEHSMEIYEIIQNNNKNVKLYLSQHDDHNSIISNSEQSRIIANFIKEMIVNKPEQVNPNFCRQMYQLSDDRFIKKTKNKIQQDSTKSSSFNFNISKKEDTFKSLLTDLTKNQVKIIKVYFREQSYYIDNQSIQFQLETTNARNMICLSTLNGEVKAKLGKIEQIDTSSTTNFRCSINPDILYDQVSLNRKDIIRQMFIELKKSFVQKFKKYQDQ